MYACCLELSLHFSEIKQLEDERHQLQVRYQQLEQQLREAEEVNYNVVDLCAVRSVNIISCSLCTAGRQESFAQGTREY